ncbi:unnamed protein product [Withania somnifera]
MEASKIHCIFSIRRIWFLQQWTTLFITFAFVIPFIQPLDYSEALSKSLLYFEAQRSGRLPYNQRATWRHHSGLADGLDQGVDLVGGYYDAGDNVKFQLPMAFTITMLSWSVIEYGEDIAAASEYRYALEAIKWGTDYFVKAHTHPHVLWVQVGEGDTDHYCWQRPEDMTTSRRAYKINKDHPGSDVAGETAAALAAASILFRRTNPHYSHLLLVHAEQLFEFGDKYRGKYDASVGAAKGYYPSLSGYKDELLWAAIWLYKATDKSYYLKYALQNAQSFGGTTWAITEFSWDVKYAGLQLLASKNNKTNVHRTPGGLLYIRQWNNMQYVSNAAFLLMVYSDHLRDINQMARCERRPVGPEEIFAFAKSQVDYILGLNPRGMSYLVGYGPKYPRRVHHRGASLDSYKKRKSFISCTQGYDNWFGHKNPNSKYVIRGTSWWPDNKDRFNDHRRNYMQTEACTYNTAPLVGLFAKLHGLDRGTDNIEDSTLFSAE